MRSEKQARKSRVRIAVLIIVAYVLSLMPTYAADINQVRDLPIYISQAKEHPSVIRGVAEGIGVQGGPRTGYVSIELDEEKSVEDTLSSAMGEKVQGLQLIVEVVSEDYNAAYYQEVIRLAAQMTKPVWVSIYTDGEGLEGVVEELQGVIEEELKSFEVHPITIVQYPKDSKQVEQLVGGGAGWLGINVETEEDLELLKKIYKTFGEQVSVIVNDYIPENSAMSAEGVIALANTFYYELPLYYPNVKMIFSQVNPSGYSPTLRSVYERILGQSWIGNTSTVSPHNGYTLVETVAEISQQAVQVLVPVRDDSIEYIEYKLNGDSLGVSKVYPYAVRVSLDDFYEGNNELKAIVKYKGDDTRRVEKVYLHSSSSGQVSERAPRTTPTYVTTSKPSYKTGYIPVLMYHKFKDKVSNTPADQSMSVSTKLFEEQIVALKKAGYTAITFADLNAYLKGTGGLPAKPYIITADDGYLDNYTHAYPILKKHNVPATFFITTQSVGIKTTNDHFTWDQAREMEASGLIDIQSHTHTHRLLDGVGKEEAYYEVARSFGEIEKELGKRDVKALAYPQFLHTNESQQWMKEFGVDLQMTRLIRKGEKTTPTQVKRIHVHNELSAKQLIKEIEHVTK